MTNSLRVHTIGGTVACDEDTSGLRIPREGKIQEIVRFECNEASRAHFDIIECSEADSIIDSSQAKVLKDIGPTVLEIRRIIRNELEKGQSLLVPMGTDVAAFYMHAIAEGVTPSMMEGRNVFGICMQDPAPNRTVGSEEREYNEGEPVVRDFDNVLYLISKECHDMIDAKTGLGRIGLFNGGILDPGRGLHKANTGAARAMQCRYEPIAKPRGGNSQDAYQSGVPEWDVIQYRPCDMPRGESYELRYRPGIESWGFDPTSSYKNLPGSVYGQVALPREEESEQELFGMVCQAPGSCNLSEDIEDLRHIHEAAKYGLDADTPVPIVIIADPLQPHYDAPGMKAGIYGGDFSRMREVLNEIAVADKKFRGTTTPVVSGGSLARVEAKMELSRIVHRGAVTKKMKGLALIRYVQRCLSEYENFIKTGENKIKGT